MIFNPEILHQYRMLFLQLRTITNPNRYFIYNIIEKEEPINVGQIVELSGLIQPIVSQTLSVLRKSNFIIAKQQNKKVYYTTNLVEAENTIQFCDAILQNNLSKEKKKGVKNNYARLLQTYKYLKALLNPARLSIIEIIAKNEGITVSKLEETTQMKQSVVSQNLAILKTLELIKSSRKGKNQLYELDADKINQLPYIVWNQR